MYEEIVNPPFIFLLRISNHFLLNLSVTVWPKSDWTWKNWILLVLFCMSPLILMMKIPRTRLLREREHFRTTYIAMTRGDGGQNLIGSEQGELLGVIRTGITRSPTSRRRWTNVQSCRGFWLFKKSGRNIFILEQRFYSRGCRGRFVKFVGYYHHAFPHNRWRWSWSSYCFRFSQ